jgi:hypothetical protein
MNVKRNMLIALFVAAAVNPVVAAEPTDAEKAALVAKEAETKAAADKAAADAAAKVAADKAKEESDAKAKDGKEEPKKEEASKTENKDVKKDESNFISNAASSTWNGLKGIGAFFVQYKEGEFLYVPATTDEKDKDGKAVVLTGLASINKTATLQAYVIRAALAFSTYKAVAFAYNNLFAQAEEEDEDNN